MTSAESGSPDAHEPVLVVTAPRALSGRLAYYSGARLTMGVLVQLAVEARHRLVLASPYLNVASLLKDGVLANSINAALARGVEIEIATAAGHIDELQAMLCNMAGAAAGRVSLYQPQANALDDRQLGSHAKFCISDAQKAYLGSANFTAPGLGGNLEMGVLVEGKLAAQISNFWTDLKAIRLFVKVLLR
jgi:phosphatidylserine/phosphatidylglycerophosphate/cardiolipin synthase-like enzyme